MSETIKGDAFEALCARLQNTDDVKRAFFALADPLPEGIKGTCIFFTEKKDLLKRSLGRMAYEEIAEEMSELIGMFERILRQRQYKDLPKWEKIIQELKDFTDAFLREMENRKTEMDSRKYLGKYLGEDNPSAGFRHDDIREHLRRLYCERF